MTNRKQATHKAIAIPQHPVNDSGTPHVEFDIIVFSIGGVLLILNSFSQGGSPKVRINFDDTPSDLHQRIIDQTVNIVSHKGIPITEHDVFVIGFAQGSNR